MAANRNAVKEARERAIFSEFAQAVGLPLGAGSLQSRQPPEPDVLCEIQGHGPVAFELIELIDQDFQERLATLGRFDLLLPMDVWQPKFEQPLIALLNASTFQRLWVFSLGQSGQPGALKLVHPAL